MTHAFLVSKEDRFPGMVITIAQLNVESPASRWISGPKNSKIKPLMGTKELPFT
jgi:hypothetical protein